jgi:hypothetical protein
MNPVRNEFEIVLGAVKILLRPTFDNIAKMENAVGGLNYLSWKFSRGQLGKKASLEVLVKDLPYLTDITKVIFYNQAKEQFTIDEIWEMVKAEGGASVTKQVVKFLGRITAGATVEVDELSAEEKKSI